MILKNDVRRGLFCFVFAIFLGVVAQAQSLYVLKNDLQTVQFEVVNVKSLSFQNGGLIVKNNNGLSSTIALMDIRYLSFANPQIALPEEAPESEENRMLKCYPNPVVSVLHIQLAAEEGEVQVEVLTTSGRVMFSQVQTLNNAECTLDVSKLSDGLYLVKTATDKGINMTSFIKK